MWVILTIVAVVALLIFFRGPNAVWGGLLLGSIAGLAVAFLGAAHFSWMTVGRGTIVGVLVGVVAELISLVTRRSRAAEGSE